MEVIKMTYEDGLSDGGCLYTDEELDLMEEYL
jgi:hypothetical protein